MRKLISFSLLIIFSLIFLSCSNDDDATVDTEKALKSYELASIEWKLTEGDGQYIFEKKLPEFYFRNESDTIIAVVIEPFSELEGSSKFSFNDSLAFMELNYSEAEVSIPKELSILSDSYSYMGRGIKVNLQQEETAFPFTFYTKDSITLNSKSELTSNYTVFLRKNKASFLATFKEINTGEILQLDGTWTGIFFNNLEEKSIINEIE